METQIIMNIANEAFKQLFWSIDRMVYWSWGVSKRVATEYHEMPTLALKVSGALHKGWVYICLNEGRDVYEVFLLNNRKREIKHLEEVFCDELGATIDGLIEREPSVTDVEYKQIVMI